MQGIFYSAIIGMVHTEAMQAKGLLRPKIASNLNMAHLPLNLRSMTWPVRLVSFKSG